MTETGRYLAKARESLASTEADAASERYNSAANRAYYAAFQASVAALLWAGVTPQKADWSHRFVMDRFSVTLIKRRKLLPPRYRGALDVLFDKRVDADYRPDTVSKRDARSGLKTAQEIVDAVTRMIEPRSIAEARAEYGSQLMTTAREYRRKATAFIQEIKDTILDAYPDCTFEVIERTPKDYRVIVKGSFRDHLDIQELIGCKKIDFLTDHDIWVVLLAEPIERAA